MFPRVPASSQRPLVRPKQAKSVLPAAPALPVAAARQAGRHAPAVPAPSSVREALEPEAERGRASAQVARPAPARSDRSRSLPLPAESDRLHLWTRGLELTPQARRQPLPHAPAAALLPVRERQLAAHR